jgi:hypothetical protein
MQIKNEGWDLNTVNSSFTCDRNRINVLQKYPA